MVIIFASLALAASQVSPTGWPSADNPKWDCGNAGGQTDINICFREQYEAAEVQMQAAYDALLADSDFEGMDPEQIISDDRRHTQMAFLIYRDSHCTTRSSSQTGGSATEMVLYACMAELTELRAQQLIDMKELF